MDNSYCDRVSDLLDKAESWAMSMVQAYTNAEVHSIIGSPGDVLDVGRFLIMQIRLYSNFLKPLSLVISIGEIIRQQASKLAKHLSDDLKDKLLTRSDSYALMREWLNTNYGGASRIVSDTIMALARRKKPAANDHSDGYLHLSAINAALQRLEKLTRTNLTLRAELKNCLYSRNTLTSMSKLLVA